MQITTRNCKQQVVNRNKQLRPTYHREIILVIVRFKHVIEGNEMTENWYFKAHPDTNYIYTNNLNYTNYFNRNLLQDLHTLISKHLYGLRMSGRYILPSSGLTCDHPQGHKLKSLL